jgi:endonuclease/exonuclease/phosphatase family metal-dependent hydrolase
MKIATHNVLFLFDQGKHRHSGKDWTYTPELVEARIAHFAALFASLDADVLFLQEVASEDVLRRIIERSGVAYSYFLGKPDRTGVGNAVLYRGEFSCSSVPAVSELPVFVQGDEDTLGPRIFSRRDFVRVQGEYAGKPLLLLGLHLKAGFLMPLNSLERNEFPIKGQLAAADGLIRSEAFRFAQAKAARQAADSFVQEHSDGQVVVAGDFNARESDAPYRIIQGVLKELPDALVSATDTLPESERVSLSGRSPVDHILLSRELAGRITSVRILNDGPREAKDVPPLATAVGSDHSPVLVELA